jgi:hypothetical protein
VWKLVFQFQQFLKLVQFGRDGLRLVLVHLHSDVSKFEQFVEQ